MNDPVCGMTVDPEHARGGSFTYQGETYFFCGPKCRERFAANPAQFLKPAEPAAVVEPPAESGQIYVCPMDPEVRQGTPGACTKCGMALKPELATAEPDNTELNEMSRRLWVSAALSAPLFAIAMGEMLLPHALAHAQLSTRT